MKKLLLILAVAVLTPALASAQSSGNFTYGTSGNSTNCVLNKNNGAIGGGALCSANSLGGVTFACTTDADCTSILGSNSGATCNTTLGQCVFPTPQTNCGGNFYSGIKTSSGNGNVFVIRPSMVIGLLTDVNVSSKQVTTTGTASSSALAGVDVTVTVGKQGGGSQPNVIPNFGVTYDARFVQISTNLFAGLSANCTSATNGCFISFAESTVSAHSFDWIVTNLSSGNYGITLNWASTVIGSGTFESLTCVGPVNLTVQQNKIFSQNSVNSF
ncbi:MAG: hypothetical protein DMG35_06745 [Acidobacteria bacterium]|nr:MAG: hypothetical protein AUH86_02120 [Acidobacteria bacterium 13_1_40CM_4_58_4]PYT62718.1 MAG: hypothetical protein DMG35_06745 [Acidobacteriota bacterium]